MFCLSGDINLHSLDTTNNNKSSPTLKTYQNCQGIPPYYYQIYLRVSKSRILFTLANYSDEPTSKHVSL